MFTVVSLRLCSYDPLLTPAKQLKSPEHPHTLYQPVNKTQVQTLAGHSLLILESKCETSGDGRRAEGGSDEEEIRQKWKQE